jgi:hypothetical protein
MLAPPDKDLITDLFDVIMLNRYYGWVRHEAPHDRVGGRAPPAACRRRPLKLEAA